MQKYIGIAACVALVGVVGGAIACGSSKPDLTDDGDAGTASDSGGASSSGSSSGASSSGGSSGMMFSGGDTGVGMGTGNCQTGMYTGTFSCGFIYDPDASAATVSDASSGFMITGNLSFVLKQSTSGELGEDTASGTFDLNAGITTGSATLGGTLECGSGQFTGALTAGTYSLLGIFTGGFAGPLTSDYNGTSFSFVNGTWELVIAGEGTCPGTWTANYVGEQ
jgi:hypothetical protein